MTGNQPLAEGELSDWAELWSGSEETQEPGLGRRSRPRRLAWYGELGLAGLALMAPLLMQHPCLPVIAATWTCIPLWVYQLLHGLGPQSSHQWSMPTSVYCAVAAPPRMRARQRTAWILGFLCLATAVCWAHGAVQLSGVAVDFVNSGHATSWLVSASLLTVVCLRAAFARRGFHRELEVFAEAYPPPRSGPTPLSEIQARTRRYRRRRGRRGKSLRRNRR